MPQIKFREFSVEQLRRFITRVFQFHRVPEPDADQAADVLVTGDLRGIDSHGVARLKAYCELLSAGQINPRPKMKVVRESPSTATVDGDSGLGLVVGPWANRLAMDKADSVGSGWVSVSNSNHFGIAGYYPLVALNRGLIGWAMTNATTMVVPLGGSQRRLGTNPLAVAFPGKEEPPIVIDMATSAVPFGRIQIAQRMGQPIPEGWAVDAQGKPTTDPAAMIAGGALLPLGSDCDHGGHKGYCLATMVDILCCVLSGANWGPFAPPFMNREINMPPRSVGKGIGHFFGALRIDGFIDPEEFKRQIDDWIRVMRETAPAVGSTGPLIPGDPERISTERRLAEGIPLLPAVVSDLEHLARQTGIPLD